MRMRARAWVCHVGLALNRIVAYINNSKAELCQKANAQRVEKARKNPNDDPKENPNDDRNYNPNDKPCRRKPEAVRSL